MQRTASRPEFPAPGPRVHPGVDQFLSTPDVYGHPLASL